MRGLDGVEESPFTCWTCELATMLRACVSTSRSCGEYGPLTGFLAGLVRPSVVGSGWLEE
jgi:hypothetical protein